MKRSLASLGLLAGCAAATPGPALLPFEAAPTGSADIVLRGTGELHGESKDRRGTVSVEATTGVSEHVAIGAVHSVVIDGAEDDVVAGFDDARLRGLVHSPAGNLYLQLSAELGLPTRSSEIGPSRPSFDLSLTVVRYVQKREVAIWLRPGFAAEVEDTDRVAAGLEAGIAGFTSWGLLALRGGATQLYRMDRDRLTGASELLIAGRWNAGFIGGAIEGGYHPEGYVQATITLGLRSAVW